MCRFRPRSSGVLTLSVSVAGYPRGLGRVGLRKRSVLAFAAAHEDSVRFYLF